MTNNLLLQPLTFWMFLILLALLTGLAAHNVRNGLGLPLLALNFTVFFWYVGDVLYNPYDEIHLVLFDDTTLAIGWLQVSGFLVFTYSFAFSFYRSYLYEESLLYLLHENGCFYSEVQDLVETFHRICLILWALLVTMAILALGHKIIYFLVPYLGVRVAPFSRPQIGGGFSAIYSLAQYTHILVASGFGMVAALATNNRIRMQAIALCILIWPYFLLARTRNTMLIVVLPALLSFIFIRLRTSNSKRLIFLLLAFLLVNFWFSFVLATRSQGQSVYRQVFNSNSSRTVTIEQTRHLGLNMYEELSWLNRMISDGSFLPNLGRRYFAELVNPVPRAIWKSKPTIGLDYAIARGQSEKDSRGTVTATISTGMIGGGINNFGRILGPVAAGLLMSFWLLFLAKMDINRNSFIRAPLVLCGLVATFNLGRDITLLSMYPVLFGWLAIVFYERRLCYQ